MSRFVCNKCFIPEPYVKLDSKSLCEDCAKDECKHMIPFNRLIENRYELKAELQKLKVQIEHTKIALKSCEQAIKRRKNNEDSLCQECKNPCNKDIAKGFLEGKCNLSKKSKK